MSLQAEDLGRDWRYPRGRDRCALPDQAVRPVIRVIRVRPFDSGRPLHLIYAHGDIEKGEMYPN